MKRVEDGPAAIAAICYYARTPIPSVSLDPRPSISGLLDP